MPGFGVTSTNSDSFAPAVPFDLGGRRQNRRVPGLRRGRSWEERGDEGQCAWTILPWLMADGRLGHGHRSLAISQQPASACLLLDLVDRARAAADRGADERALLAAEDGAEARAGRRRAADRPSRSSSSRAPTFDAPHRRGSGRADGRARSALARRARPAPHVVHRVARRGCPFASDTASAPDAAVADRRPGRRARRRASAGRRGYVYTSAARDARD